MIVITDSSTLILMAKAELIDTAIELFSQLLITKAVFEEVVEKGKAAGKFDAFLVESRINENKIVIGEDANREFSCKLEQDFNLHEGEAGTICMYLEKNADLLGIDDRKGIQVCKLFRVRFFTCLSFLLISVDKNRIGKKDALKKLSKLKECGRYTGEEISRAHELIGGQ